MGFIFIYLFIKKTNKQRPCAASLIVRGLYWTLVHLQEVAFSGVQLQNENAVKF